MPAQRQRGDGCGEAPARRSASVISGRQLLGGTAVLAEQPLEGLVGVEDRESGAGAGPPGARGSAASLRSPNRAITSSK